jgi:hypothetical protein
MPHTPLAELVVKLEEAQKKITIGDVYRHYKTRQLYEVLYVALQENIDDACIVYQPVSGPRLIWVRNLESWLEEIEVDGVTVPRFKKEEKD